MGEPRRVRPNVLDPIRPNPGAAGQVLVQRFHHRRSPLQHAVHPVQGELINHHLASPVAGDQAAVPQAGEMGADSGLRLPDCKYQLAHASVAQLQEFEYPQPRRVPQNPKESSGGDGIDGTGDRRVHIWKAGYHWDEPKARRAL